MSSNTTIALEDNVSDVLKKAQHGLGLSDSTLAGTIGVASGELEAVRLLQGISPAAEEPLATALQLDYPSLLRLPLYYPVVTEPSIGFYMTNTPYGEVNVNAYLIWDPVTLEAAIFDTGTDCMLLVSEIQRLNLTVKGIFLTHTHGDHIAELDRFVEKISAWKGAPAAIPVYVAEAEAEAIPGAIPFKPGVTFDLGKLQIETRDTSGHSLGGTSYAIHGLNAPLIIVGDALFAGSVGGIRVEYKDALARIRTQILSGQDNTILAPGHGPLTTVLQEKQNNPFFPELKK